MTMKIYICLFIFFGGYNAFSQDERTLRSISQIFNDGDGGIIITKSNDELICDEFDTDVFVEKIFENKISGNKIYFTGAEYRGKAVFWIIDNGDKVSILNTGVRYGARIIWHGENIAEIPIPSGSPVTGSYYYNFSNGLLSSYYIFPLYYDIENDLVLTWGNEDFELYEIKTNELIKVFDH
jgi:hypothetical protein